MVKPDWIEPKTRIKMQAMIEMELSRMTWDEPIILAMCKNGFLRSLTSSC